MGSGGRGRGLGRGLGRRYGGGTTDPDRMNKACKSTCIMVGIVGLLIAAGIMAYFGGKPLHDGFVLGGDRWSCKPFSGMTKGPCTFKKGDGTYGTKKFLDNTLWTAGACAELVRKSLLTDYRTTVEARTSGSQATSSCWAVLGSPGDAITRACPEERAMLQSTHAWAPEPMILALNNGALPPVSGFSLQ